MKINEKLIDYLITNFRSRIILHKSSPFTEDSDSRSQLSLCMTFRYRRYCLNEIPVYLYNSSTLQYTFKILYNYSTFQYTFKIPVHFKYVLEFQYDSGLGFRISGASLLRGYLKYTQFS